MGSDGQRHNHIEGTTIGMSQRQERQRTRVTVMQLGTHSVGQIAGQIVQRKHHSLAETRCSGCVINDCCMVGRYGQVILDVLRSKRTVISILELGIQCRSSICSI